MKLLPLLALATMAATAAPAFADSVVPGSDAAFYSQAAPAPASREAGSTARYGMPRTASTGAAAAAASSDDLVPGSDASFLSSAPKSASTHARPVRTGTSVSPDMVPGSGAAFMN